MKKFCSKCGKENKATSKYCEFCGNQLAEEKAEVVKTEAVSLEPTPNNGMAIAGFVLSFFVPLLGLIFSIIGLSKANSLNGNKKGLAIAGIIISAVTIVFRIVFGLGVFAGIMDGLSSYGYYY